MDVHSLLYWWLGVGFISAICIICLGKFDSHSPKLGIGFDIFFIILFAFSGFGSLIILVGLILYLCMYKQFPEGEEDGFSILSGVIWGISICGLMAICVGSLGGDALDSLEKGAKIQQEQLISEDMIAFKGWSKISGNRFELTFEEWQILRKQGLIKNENQ